MNYDKAFEKFGIKSSDFDKYIGPEKFAQGIKKISILQDSNASYCVNTKCHSKDVTCQK